MRSRRRLIFLFGSVVALGVLAWLLFRSRGPSYQGKSLDYWLAQIAQLAQLRNGSPRGGPPNPNTPNPSAAQVEGIIEAVRAMGTNALPQLLAGLESQDPPFKQRLIDLTSRLPFLKYPVMMTEEERRESSGLALQMLGSRAGTAIPALTKILDHADSDLIDRVPSIFFCMGSNGIPPLIQALQHTNTQVRAASVSALGHYAWSTKPGGGFDNELIEHFAVQIVPALVPLASDSNPEVRQRVADALGPFRHQPEVVVPVLIKLLEDTNVLTRHYAIHSLGQFGTNAQPAVPSLIKFLTDTSQIAVVGEATRVIKLIDAQSVPRVVIPALTASLTNSNAAVRSAAAFGLRALGNDAAPAVPALLENLKDPDRDTRNSAADVLQAIDPTAIPHPQK